MKRNLAQLFNPTKYVEFQCPSCGSSIPYLDVKITFGLGYATEYFECSTCRSALCVSRIYVWSVFIATLIFGIFTVAALKYLGVRPWWFLGIVALVVWRIVGMAEGLYLKWLFPPRIELRYPGGPAMTFPRRRVDGDSTPPGSKP